MMIFCSCTNQGLVSNGAKVYVTALPTDEIDGAVKELNDLGKTSGGSAIGYDCEQKPV
jgi:phenylacetate 2-hydroxylase